MLKSHFLVVIKKDKKGSESSYKAMSECPKIQVRSTAVVPVVSLFESHSQIMTLHYRLCEPI